METNPITDLIRNIPKSYNESIRTLITSSKPMLFLFASFAIYHFAWFMCSLNLIIYATEVMNISDFDWATLWAWFSVVNVLSALPCGKIIDRFGRKKPLTVAWFLFIPGLVGFVYGNVIIISASLLLLGIALILANIAYQALMTDFVAREKRGKIIGSTNFFFNILSASGTLSGGFMYQYVSPALPFIFSAVLFVPCFFLTLFKVHDPVSREI